MPVLAGRLVNYEEKEELYNFLVQDPPTPPFAERFILRSFRIIAAESITLLEWKKNYYLQLMKISSFY